MGAAVVAGLSRAVQGRSLATRGCRAPDLELGHPLHGRPREHGQAVAVTRPSAPRHTGGNFVVESVEGTEPPREPALGAAALQVCRGPFRVARSRREVAGRPTWSWATPCTDALANTDRQSPSRVRPHHVTRGEILLLKVLRVRNPRGSRRWGRRRCRFFAGRSGSLASATRGPRAHPASPQPSEASSASFRRFQRPHLLVSTYRPET